MCRTILCSLAFVLLAGQAALAQDPDFKEDLRFAEALRLRGDNALALEFLQKLQKTASPGLARELSLEIARTSLRAAAEVPEAARRLQLSHEARAAFQQFINENPDHPRIAEANLDLARVLNFQGKTELNQARLSGDGKDRTQLLLQARA